MKNPTLKNVIVLLLIGLTSHLAATRVIPLEEVSKPRLIAVSDTHCFISETGHVLVYSLKNGKFLKKLGKKGQRGIYHFGFERPRTAQSLFAPGYNVFLYFC